MSQLRFVLVGLFCAALVACGGSSGDGDDDAVDAAGNVDTAIPDGWTSLMEGDWSLGAGEEGYFCIYATVPRDIYIKAFRPLIPLGTHHTVVTRYTGVTTDTRGFMGRPPTGKVTRTDYDDVLMPPIREAIESGTALRLFPRFAKVTA